MNSIPLWKLLKEAITSNTPCGLLITVETDGSGPGRPGAAMAVVSGGKTSGTVGGGTMEYSLVTRTRRLLESHIHTPEIITYNHLDSNSQKNADSGSIPSGMICSGSQKTAVIPMRQYMLDTVDTIISMLKNDETGTIFLSGKGLAVSISSAQETHEFSMSKENSWEYSAPIGLRDTIYIVGGGHVGRALANLLQNLPFQAVIIDRRERDSFEDPPSCRWITAPFSEAHNLIPEGRHSWAVIVTPSHAADAGVLENLSGKDLKYVGLMASSEKKAAVYSDLLQKGVGEDFLESVYCPIGIPIGSRTPQEIAISITAQLLRVRTST